MAEYRAWNQTYLLDEDPEDWPETIDGLISFLEGLRARGYSRYDYDDEVYASRRAHFDFTRDATPDEVRAETEKAAAGRVAALERAKEKERRTYERLKTKFGGE